MKFILDHYQVLCVGYVITASIEEVYSEGVERGQCDV